MSNIKLSSRLVSIEVAAEWMAAFAPEVEVVDFKVRTNLSCFKCGGSGYIPCYSYHDGGVCYQCGGKNTNHLRNVMQCVLPYAKKVAPGIRKAARVRAAYEAECARNEAAGHGYVGDRTVQQNARDAAYAAKQAERDAERQKAPDVPEGRVEVNGTIVKLEWKENAYGERLVMTVLADEGYLLWGSCPSSIAGDADKGSKVQFIATLERSDRDPKFGFYKRPSKAIIKEEEAA